MPKIEIQPRGHYPVSLLTDLNAITERFQPIRDALLNDPKFENIEVTFKEYHQIHPEGIPAEIIYFLFDKIPEFLLDYAAHEVIKVWQKWTLPQFIKYPSTEKYAIIYSNEKRIGMDKIAPADIKYYKISYQKLNYDKTYDEHYFYTMDIKERSSEELQVQIEFFYTLKEWPFAEIKILQFEKIDNPQFRLEFISGENSDLN
jgi:hypothetical protein